MIRAIIFDCFGVLTADKWKEFVGSLPNEQKERARELNRELDRGNISLTDFSTGIHTLSGHSPDLVENVINHEEMHKNTDLLGYIKELHSNYKIGLLSNVSTNWIRDVFLTEEEQGLFDDVLLSYEAKTVKPDPAIFKLAAQRLGVKPQECVFIDDGQRNCDGAAAVGMKTVLYDNYAQCKRQLESLLKA